MPIIWNSAMQTGDRQIDEQHQELVAILNQLEAAQIAGGDDELLHEIFMKLKAYVLFHFGTEEMKMNHAHVPYAHRHVHLLQHQAFADWLAQEEAKVIKDIPGLVAYLTQWLIDHIEGIDRTMVRLRNRHEKSQHGMTEPNGGGGKDEVQG